MDKVCSNTRSYGFESRDSTEAGSRIFTGNNMIFDESEKVSFGISSILSVPRRSESAILDVL